jgi:hypothetical protein
MNNTGLKGPKDGTMLPLEIGSIYVVVRLFPADSILSAISLSISLSLDRSDGNMPLLPG